jgi:uncharacterized protein (DUF849 family)
VLEKLIITAALTGSELTKEQAPFLSITPDEIAEEALKCCRAGASVVHIHARDPKTGVSSSDLKIYREIASKIKGKCDIIVNFTTGGAIDMTDQERIAIIPSLKPEFASLDMGSMNFYVPSEPETWQMIFENRFSSIEYFAKTMEANGTKPECEVYDISMVQNIRMMIDRNVIKSPPNIQFVLGVNGGIPATSENLLYLIRTAKDLLPGCKWSVCAVGRHEFPLATLAIIEGGSVRVGMEDNLYLAKGVMAKSNAELVDKVANIAKLLGRETASPNEAREILGLKGSNLTNF